MPFRISPAFHGHDVLVTGQPEPGSSLQPDGLAPVRRNLRPRHPLALRLEEVPGNPGRADRADQPRNRRGPALEVVVAEMVQVVAVRAGVDGEKVTVAFLKEDNHAASPDYGPGRKPSSRLLSLVGQKEGGP